MSGYTGGSTVNLKPERPTDSVAILAGKFSWAVLNREGYVVALFSQKYDATAFIAAYVEGYYTLREVENDK